MPMSTPDPWLKRLLLDPVDLAARVRRCVCAARARWTAAKDRAVLVAFYHATYGSDWTTSTNWLTRKPIGTWWGVETNMAGRVTGLWLKDNLLSDSLPPELGQLTELRWLNLSYNHLSGPLPPELGQLASLEALHLSDNHLRGPLPPGLGHLAHLKALDLSYNELIGRVPSEWLKNLTLVDLAGNRLAGDG